MGDKNSGKIPIYILILKKIYFLIFLSYTQLVPVISVRAAHLIPSIVGLFV